MEEEKPAYLLPEIKGRYVRGFIDQTFTDFSNLESSNNFLYYSTIGLIFTKEDFLKFSLFGDLLESFRSSATSYEIYELCKIFLLMDHDDERLRYICEDFPYSPEYSMYFTPMICFAVKGVVPTMIFRRVHDEENDRFNKFKYRFLRGTDILEFTIFDKNNYKNMIDLEQSLSQENIVIFTDLTLSVLQTMAAKLSIDHNDIRIEKVTDFQDIFDSQPVKSIQLSDPPADSDDNDTSYVSPNESEVNLKTIMDFKEKDPKEEFLTKFSELFLKSVKIASNPPPKTKSQLIYYVMDNVLQSVPNLNLEDEELTELLTDRQYTYELLNKNIVDYKNSKSEGEIGEQEDTTNKSMKELSNKILDLTSSMLRIENILSGLESRPIVAKKLTSTPFAGPSKVLDPIKDKMEQEDDISPFFGFDINSILEKDKK